MEKQIIDYTVVIGGSSASLNDEVKHYMRSGWQPLGSVSVSACANGMSGIQYTFAQAMMKYEFIEQTYSIETEIDIPVNAIMKGPTFGEVMSHRDTALALAVSLVTSDGR